jgi:hypothetical protein
MASIQHEDLPVSRDIPPAEMQQQQLLPNGGAAAALVAAGIGCLTMGVLTVLETAIGGLHTLLQFYPPAGSISGITSLMVVAWLVSWVALNRLWKSKQMNFTRMFVITLVCILLGMVGIFPPFVHLFA